MKVVVGLGNPGREYNNTRHNAGFVFIDKLIQRLECDALKFVDKFQSEITQAVFEGEKLLLVKPQTFMNLSGLAVKKIVDFYKLDMEDLIVAYDDVDIDLGEIRLRLLGSAGSHNGARSIRESLGDFGTMFPRIRIGIKSSLPEGVNMDLAAYVLKKMNEQELNELNKGIDKGVECLLFALEQGYEAAMQAYN